MPSLRIASDLHLEAFPGIESKTLLNGFLPQDERDAGSALILAGDISSDQRQLLDFLSCAADRFERVMFVPGNHSFYRHDYKKWFTSFRKAELKPNIVAGIDDVTVCEHDGVRFLMTTLWGDGGQDANEQMRVDNALNDFKVIAMGKRRFTVVDMIEIHKRQKSALVQALSKPYEGKTVVITHHLPSYKLCHPRFGDSIRGGFASDCDDILSGEFAPNLWIHGHTHDRISTKLWNTQIECNPSGYRREWNTEFNSFHSTPVFLNI